MGWVRVRFEAGGSLIAIVGGSSMVMLGGSFMVMAGGLLIMICGISVMIDRDPLV